VKVGETVKAALGHIDRHAAEAGDAAHLRVDDALH
jgi:hypothetical protein